tara:strand:- start:3414 stop:5360 length:1947 start_codon:yes stop_codon:yes gene_type:complete
MFGQDIFGTNLINERNIKEEIKDCDVVFVSDLYVDDYIGGAELTTEVLYQYSNHTFVDKKVCKIKSDQVNKDLIQAGLLKKWIFFNYASMSINLIPVIVANLNYSIVEYDYKFCKYRSTEKHLSAEGKECDCHDQQHGKIISAFMYGADFLFWMSEAQKNFYLQFFPFLSSKDNTVVTSAFSKETLALLRDLRSNSKERKQKAIIIGSNSWIKGIDDSVEYCKRELSIDYDIVSNLSHSDLLEKLSEYEHFVFMPKGKDTCPRIVIEAKLAGCKIHINDNVQHKEESWWNKDPDSIDNFLRNGPQEKFWGKLNGYFSRSEKVSGYTTTRDCIDQKYPFRQCIESMLGFCDQVVVVDGGSTDGTWEALKEIAQKDDRILIEQRIRDWNHPRFAVFDGLQKAYARSLCTGKWCWQMDSDEIVHERDYEKVKKLLKDVPKSIHLLALPVVEYWGGPEKVRVDVNPWKWRFSRNLKHITHGIPAQLRKTDDEGNLYSLPGSDGCDYIDKDSYQTIPCMHFYDQNIHDIRISALKGDQKAAEAYENWFNNLIENLPGVHHYSWFDLERKIHTYKNYWSKHWQSLYNIEQKDTPENNMFFDKSWEDVTNDEIKDLSKKLKEEMGGWIFHNKVDFNQRTPYVLIERGEPENMRDE